MIAEPILTNLIYNPLLLLVSLIALTFVLFAIRFVMIYGYYAYRTRRLKKKLNKYMKVEATAKVMNVDLDKVNKSMNLAHFVSSFFYLLYLYLLRLDKTLEIFFV